MEKINKNKFRNALCGLPSNHKSWQEWYKEGNMDEVYNYWKNLADEEKKNNPNMEFWAVIIEMIEYKQK